MKWQNAKRSARKRQKANGAYDCSETDQMNTCVSDLFKNVLIWIGVHYVGIEHSQ